MTIAVVEHARKVKGAVRHELRDALDARGGEVAWTAIAKASKATDAVAKAVESGVEAVIVAGGDGTVRAASQALVDTDVPLAVVPTGTANLFANAHDLPFAPADVVALLTSGERVRLDTGACNDLTFNVMGGAGLDAAMIDDADAGKARLGVLSYVKAGVSHARNRQPFQAAVTVDGAPFFEGPATCVLVGNVGTLKGGLVAFPDASPTDGCLDVAVVTAVGLREWASLMVSAARGRQTTTGHAHVGQGASIDVRLDGKHRFELDGGAKGTAKRLRFDVRPSSLLLCAPSR